MKGFDSETWFRQRMLKMELPGRRIRARLQRRLMDVLKEDMEQVGMTEEDTSDEVRWRQMIH